MTAARERALYRIEGVLDDFNDSLFFFFSDRCLLLVFKIKLMQRHMEYQVGKSSNKSISNWASSSTQCNHSDSIFVKSINRKVRKRDECCKQ